MLDVKIKKQLKDFVLDISLHSFNDRISILGASGTGKSMALKCIAGLENPDSGRIVLNDRVLYDSDLKINLSPQERKVGYLFQNYALFPHMSVYENISFVCDDVEKVKNLINLFQLEGLEKQLPKNISGGQRQRVALARIFAYEPDVLLLDEPFTALDVNLKDQLHHQLLSYLANYNKDIIIVTHDQDEAFSLCEKMMVIKDGINLCQPTSSQALYCNPKQVNIAKSLGCRNFSRVNILDNNKLELLDWGITIHTKKDIPLETTHIGLYNNSFYFDDSYDAISIEIEELVNKISSYNIIFKFNKDFDSIVFSCDKRLYDSQKNNTLKIIEDDIMYLIDKEKE